MKNLKPRSIAFLTSLIVALTIAAVTMLFSKNTATMFAVFAAAFLTSYFVYLYFIQNFIYRKIKVIYKNIHTLKSGKDEQQIRETLTDDPLETVNREVMEWEEEKKKEIESLRQLEIYRKEFVANVSHELKTPLFNIQGYIHTLLDGAIDDKEVNRNFLDKAARNVDRLVSLVGDLEVISQLETGDKMLEVETFDIHSLVNDVFESLEFRARLKKILFGFKKGSEESQLVVGDKDKIRQVLVNLIENSLKYGKESGATQVGFYDMDENILVEITDDGIGIEEKHLPRLFERFYRVDKSRSREAGGTGLGLSIVKHIIEAHGQTIAVRSRVGVGTTFGFTIKKA